MKEKCFLLRNGRTMMMVMKIAPSKSALIRFNLILFSLSFLLYTAFSLHPSSSVYFRSAASFVGCSFRHCTPKVTRGVKMQELIVENQINKIGSQIASNQTKLEAPSFMEEILTRGLGKTKIGMVNMEEADLTQWKRYGETNHIHFDRVSKLFTWHDLFPEWIDEEEDHEVPTCPEIPMPDLERLEKFDLIVVKLPCKYPEEGWRREVLRLQVNLVAANLVAKKGKTDWTWKSKVLFWSKCQPMIEIFRCDDLEKREGNWWLYRPEVVRLQQKVSLPIGSCNLALPLWAPQGIDKVYDLTKIKAETRRPKREAYATVLHSSESYVCGAITLAQSLLKTNTKRDLILLHDDSISITKLRALAAAGWKLRRILRIRNPLAEKDSYNEYNYSKFRLWQLTDYDKVVFIDADIIVLLNLDLLFHFPQMSATGNDVWIFNSGVMVIEPSNCTFSTIMSQRNDIVSYNGGDQGENITTPPPLLHLDAGEAHGHRRRALNSVCVITYSLFFFVVFNICTRTVIVSHAAAPLDPLVITFSPPIRDTTASHVPLLATTHPLRASSPSLVMPSFSAFIVLAALPFMLVSAGSSDGSNGLVSSTAMKTTGGPGVSSSEGHCCSSVLRNLHNDGSSVWNIRSESWISRLKDPRWVQLHPSTSISLSLPFISANKKSTAVLFSHRQGGAVTTTPLSSLLMCFLTLIFKPLTPSSKQVTLRREVAPPPRRFVPPTPRRELHSTFLGLDFKQQGF
ncbi:BnaC03g66670D [Brassica napus]|uniref:BnaC03g66670D protein n=3 Tax=Brassica TaxID=3705 RepID=A0A078GT12_BRANA|nr:BnaC03g66670D [Brassica napus]VDD00296.1 unnamed protein product [Brassica oleracea]